MSHVDDGTLNALVDGELDVHQRAAVEVHLAACGDCARRVAEATALAQQVTSLLTTLDVFEPPVRTMPAPMPTEAPVSRPPARRSPITLRRLAMAASVLLVAGVSYEVGRRNDSAAVPVATPESAPLGAIRDPNADAVGGAVAASSAALPSSPAVSSPAVSSPAVSSPAAAAPIVMAPSAPSATTMSKPTSAPVAERSVTAQFAPLVADARRRASAEASKVAESRAAADAPAIVVARRRSMDVSAAESPRRMEANAARAGLATAAADAARTLPGYRSVDIADADALVRTQFIAADGVTLLLVITPDSAVRSARAVTTGAAAFTVSTVEGRSTVQWTSQGRAFDLRGPLAPDSLLKLATLLR